MLWELLSINVCKNHQHGEDDDDYDIYRQLINLFSREASS